MLLLSGIDRRRVALLLMGYGLELRVVFGAEDIPGSYWGESEAGLRGQTLFARPDTPMHSVLHEAAHYLCMTPERRAGLDRDAGGDDAEETAVCYLQVILGDQLPAVGRDIMFRDMDEWGYSFRLGSAGAWFEQDAQDARAWLIEHGLIDEQTRLTGQLRL